MPKSENQKLKLLYIKDFLERNTDDNHGVTVQEIISHLAGRGISAERKSIYNDLSLLEDYLDVVKEKKGTETRYHVASRNFEMVELKILADSVKASKYLPEEKADRIIAKLGGLCSEHEARELKRSLYVPAQSISNNQKIFITIDAIERAIEEGRQLSFAYFKYNEMGQREMVHQGARYKVTPLLLLLDDYYYLVAWDERENKKKHFRVDRMENAMLDDQEATVSDETRVDKTQYKNRHFNMFDGQEYDVVMEFDQALLNSVFDRFGRDHTPIPSGKGRFRWTERVAVCGQFYGWVASFGGKARILGPERVLEEYRDFLNANVDANN